MQSTGQTGGGQPSRGRYRQTRQRAPGTFPTRGALTRPRGTARPGLATCLGLPGAAVAGWDDLG